MPPERIGGEALFCRVEAVDDAGAEGVAWSFPTLDEAKERIAAPQGAGRFRCIWLVERVMWQSASGRHSAGWAFTWWNEGVRGHGDWTEGPAQDQARPDGMKQMRLITRIAPDAPLDRDEEVPR